MSNELKDCPFCGGKMEPFGPAQHNHPRNECWLAAVKVVPEEYERWNARALAAPVASAAPSGELPPLPEPLAINWPTVHSNALGCGVEDRNIRDRYEAAEYGFEDGVQKAACCVPDVIYDADQVQAYARAAIAASAPNKQLVEAPNMDDWNVQMACVKALLNCTDGELECTGLKLLDSYIEDVKRVVAAALAAAGA